MGQKGASARARRAAARRRGVARALRAAERAGALRGWREAKRDLTRIVEDRGDAVLLGTRPDHPYWKVPLTPLERFDSFADFTEAPPMSFSLRSANFRAVRMRQVVAPDCKPVEWFAWELTGHDHQPAVRHGEFKVDGPPGLAEIFSLQGFPLDVSLQLDDETRVGPFPCVRANLRVKGLGESGDLGCSFVCGNHPSSRVGIVVELAERLRRSLHDIMRHAIDRAIRVNGEAIFDPDRHKPAPPQHGERHT